MKIIIAVDQENNAERFWDFVHGLSEDGIAQAVPASVAPLLRRSGGPDSVKVSKAEADEFRLWLKTLGEMACDGPEYAKDPFTFSDE